MAAGWGVLLNDVFISCGEEPPECLGPEVRSLGFLNAPPEGLGVPEIRTEDITYPQRDGVRMFYDWYNPRQITLSVSVTEADVPCGEDGTPCITVREAVARIMKAWSRHCANTELAIFTDCTGHGETILTGTQHNLISNPSSEVTVDGWAAVDTAFTPLRLQATDAPQGAFVTRTGRDVPGGALMASYALHGILPHAGTFTLSVSGVRGTINSIPGVQVAGSGVAVAAEQTFPTNPSAWHSADLTFDWDGTGDAYLYTLDRNTALDATTVDIDGLMLVVGPDLVDYFDGDTPDESTVIHSWDGTPGLSTSTRNTYAIDNSLVGPYGVIGRPRQAQLTWGATPGYAADIVLRFDAVDQNMWVLDECGNPGSGVQTVELETGTSSTCTPIPMCFGERVTETLSFSWEARSYTVDGITHVELWITSGTFPAGTYTEQGTGFGLSWDGVPVEQTWDTIDPAITWDSLGGPFAQDIDNPTDLVTPPEQMITSGVLINQGGAFSWVVNGPWDITFEAFGNGSASPTPEVVASGSVTYERPSGEVVDGVVCFDQETGDDARIGTALVTGTECVSPTIELCGKLTNPIIENITTGQSLRYRGVIRAEDPCVVIDTTDGTATQGDQSRTHLLTGDTRMVLQPGDNELRLVSFSRADDGYATISHRSAVIFA